MESPFVLTQALERQLAFQIARLDRDGLSRSTLATIDVIKREMTDARLDIRDYELSETRMEQVDNATEAKRRLKLVTKNLLAASEHDIFGAAEVAQISAQIEYITSKLQ